MPPRQSRPPAPPTRWLMTDERMGDGLWRALERLPRGSGVIFRHYSLAASERRGLFEHVRRVTRRRGLLLSLADVPARAAAWRADGAHGPSPHRVCRPLLRSMACHDPRTLVAARRAGIALRFVSPVFATRSHPGRRALGPVRLGLMIRGEGKGLVALGGMDQRRARAIRPLGILRWAAIDAWL